MGLLWKEGRSGALLCLLVLWLSALLCYGTYVEDERMEQKERDLLAVLTKYQNFFPYKIPNWKAALSAPEALPPKEIDPSVIIMNQEWSQKAEVTLPGRKDPGPFPLIKGEDRPLALELNYDTSKPGIVQLDLAEMVNGVRVATIRLSMPRFCGLKKTRRFIGRLSNELRLSKWKVTEYFPKVKGDGIIIGGYRVNSDFLVWEFVYHFRYELIPTLELQNGVKSIEERHFDKWFYSHNKWVLLEEGLLIAQDYELPITLPPIQPSFASSSLPPIKSILGTLHSVIPSTADSLYAPAYNTYTGASNVQFQQQQQQQIISTQRFPSNQHHNQQVMVVSPPVPTAFPSTFANTDWYYYHGPSGQSNQITPVPQSSSASVNAPHFPTQPRLDNNVDDHHGSGTSSSSTTKPGT